MRGTKDTVVEIATSELVSKLIAKLSEEAKGQGVRLFFSGKEMQPDKAIGVYTDHDAVITVFYRPAPPS